MWAILNVALSSLLFSVKADDAFYKYPESNFRLVKKAFNLDPIKNKIFRDQIPGAYRTAFGLQISKECIEYARSNLKIPQTQIEKRLEYAVYNIFRAVIDECRSKYPELEDPYLLEWVTQARRAFIKCQSYEDILKNSGVSSSTAQQYKVTATNDSQYSLIDQTVIKYPLKDLDAFLYGDELVIEDLIHEIFHSTSANDSSPSLHNENQMSFLTEEIKSCDNLVNDRVKFIPFLCMAPEKYPHHFLHRMPGTETIQELLYLRMKRCGIKKGCGELFTSSQALPIIYGQKSEGLPVNQADRLCLKIYDEGACKALAKDSYAIRKRDPIQKVGARAAAKLDEVLPKTTNDIPAKLLEIYPDIKNKIDRIRQSSCFKAIFKEDKDQNLILPPTIYLDARSLNWPDELLDYSLFAKKNTAIHSAIQKNPHCKENTLVRDEITNLFDRFNNAVENDIFHSSSFLSTLGQRYLQKFETDYIHDTDAPFMQSLLGTQLFEEYKTALKRYHYLSPDFDCKAAGLSMFSTYYQFQEVKTAVQNPNPKLNNDGHCP